MHAAPTDRGNARTRGLCEHRGRKIVVARPSTALPGGMADADTASSPDQAMQREQQHGGGRAKRQVAVGAAAAAPQCAGGAAAADSKRNMARKSCSGFAVRRPAIYVSPQQQQPSAATAARSSAAAAASSPRAGSDQQAVTSAVAGAAIETPSGAVDSGRQMFTARKSCSGLASRQPAGTPSAITPRALQAAFASPQREQPQAQQQQHDTPAATVAPSRAVCGTPGMHTARKSCSGLASRQPAGTPSAITPRALQAAFASPQREQMQPQQQQHGTPAATAAPSSAVCGTPGMHTARKSCSGLAPRQPAGTPSAITPRVLQAAFASPQPEQRQPQQQQQQPQPGWQLQPQQQQQEQQQEQQPKKRRSKQQQGGVAVAPGSQAGQPAAAAAASGPKPGRKRKQSGTAGGAAAAPAPGPAETAAAAAGTPAATPQQQQPSKKKRRVSAAAAHAPTPAAAPPADAAATPATAAAAAAGAGASGRMRRAPRKPAHWGVSDREAQSLAGNASARLLFEAHWAGVAAAVADMGAAVAAAEAAEQVVMSPDGSKPLWDLTEEEVQVVDGANLTSHLSDTAIHFAAGKEPWRRFAVPAKLLAKHKAAAAAAAAAAEAGDAGASDGEAQAAAAAAAADRRGGGGGVEGLPWAFCADAVAAGADGPRLYVAEEPYADDDAAQANAIRKGVDSFWAHFRLASVSEEARVASKRAELQAAAEQQQQQQQQGAAGEDGQAPAAGEKLKNPSSRPDRVAESQMLGSGLALNDRDSWGHVPGIRVNNKTQLRSETSVLGLHKSPMTGIVSGTLPVDIVTPAGTARGVRAATSIVMSGLYEDDVDTPGDIIAFTGEGGNDLLGNKRQRESQQLKRGNKALLANAALGLPVRLLRRNDVADGSGSASQTVIVYDGLYDVVSYAKTKGKSEHTIFVFGLRRRPGQEPSLSKPIERFKGVGTAKRTVDVSTRAHIVCKDLSKGREPLPLVVVNEVDRELPPGLKLPEDAAWIVDDRDDADAGPLIPSDQEFRYITSHEYAPGVVPPAPPRVIDAADAGDDDADGAADAAAGRWRLQERCKAVVVRRPGEAPHELLRRVNWGQLPYRERPGTGGEGEAGGGGRRGSKKDKAISYDVCLVLTECGDWTGCTDANCKQRQAHRGLSVRLEVFKTRHCGWGVRSWQRIQQGALVCIMWGRIHKVEDTEAELLGSSYIFDMVPRAGFAADGQPLADGNAREQATKFVVCSKQQGGVARFINHSCQPNLYVQPMCVGHTDTDMVAIGLFAGLDIPAFTELTYDYGESYVVHDLSGVCYCGADCCKFKPGQARAAAAGEDEEEEEQGGEEQEADGMRD